MLLDSEVVVVARLNWNRSADDVGLTPLGVVTVTSTSPAVW